MYVHHTPGYPATCDETYFGILAKFDPSSIGDCVKTVSALEGLMPKAWDGMRVLIAMNDHVPANRECRSAYECLRGAFAALHSACTVQAQEIMFSACHTTGIKIRKRIIIEALRKASGNLGVQEGERIHRAAEVLRTSQWIDPFAFGRAMKDLAFRGAPPSLAAQPAEWISFAQAAMHGQSKIRETLESLNADSCDHQCTKTKKRRGLDSAGPRSGSLASVIDALRISDHPEPVAHIIERCITLYAAYEGTLMPLDARLMLDSDPETKGHIRRRSDLHDLLMRGAKQQCQ